MSASGDGEFVETAKRQLDRYADALDEATLQRLEHARRQAVRRQTRRWPAAAAVATAAAVLIAVLTVIQSNPPRDPVEWDLWVAQDDIEVIEALDFYAWLEATQPNS